MATTKQGSEFIVKLDGLKLSPAAETRINKEIQAAVLREIAQIDTGGDLTIRRSLKEWLGLWLRNRAFDNQRPGEKQLGLEVREIQR